jgi:hypothetical protein
LPIRAIVVAAVGCVAALGTGGTSAAEPPPAQAEPSPSELAQFVGADLGTVIRALPGVLCGNRLIAYNSPTTDSPTRCVNGPERSGNSVNSGNYHSTGDPVNSGNFSNVNGSAHSNNAVESGNNANGAEPPAGGR